MTRQWGKRGDVSWLGGQGSIDGEVVCSGCAGRGDVGTCGRVVSSGTTFEVR